MDSYQIGIVGWGVVGGGVIELLQREAPLLRERCAVDLRLKAVVSLDWDRPRQQTLPEGCALGPELELITQDPEIRCVLHLIGGTTAAFDIAAACLRAGKHVVTSNKALLAERWDELMALAAEHGRGIAFEAAVGGGMPVIAALRDGLVANRIQGLQAILNGTSNYVLTRMEEAGLSFDEALAEAQAAGYAEADPTLDLNGTDTAHKLAILARIAFNAPVQLRDLSVEGIQSITSQDLASAWRLGCRIKLLAVAEQREDGVELRVAPTLVPLETPLANVMHNYNGVRLVGEAAGPTLLVGQGAGALPTASAVLADTIDIATGRYQATAQHFRFFTSRKQLRVYGEAEELTASYGRFQVDDRPGVLAHICQCLSSHGINLLSVQQAQPEQGQALIEITTHPARSGDFLTAVAEIDAAPYTLAPAVVLRRLHAEH